MGQGQGEQRNISENSWTVVVHGHTFKTVSKKAH